MSGSSVLLFFFPCFIGVNLIDVNNAKIVERATEIYTLYKHGYSNYHCYLYFEQHLGSLVCFYVHQVEKQLHIFYGALSK